MTLPQDVQCSVKFKSCRKSVGIDTHLQLSVCKNIIRTVHYVYRETPSFKHPEKKRFMIHKVGPKQSEAMFVVEEG